MMAAAKIDPFHPGYQVTEMLLYKNKGFLQIIRVLFAQSVKMNAIQEIQKLRIF